MNKRIYYLSMEDPLPSELDSPASTLNPIPVPMDVPVDIYDGLRLISEAIKEQGAPMHSKIIMALVTGIMYANQRDANLRLLCEEAIKGLYGMCPIALAYMPADAALERLKTWRP